MHDRASLVKFYIGLCRSPVVLTFSEWIELPPEHREALEEAAQAARKLSALEAAAFRPEHALIDLSVYDGGEALKSSLMARNCAAFQVLAAAGVSLERNVPGSTEDGADAIDG